MLGYPFDLILAVATASATIFLGFLPTKSIRSSFFAREALLAAFAWTLVTFSSPLQISHFLMPLAFFCGGAWWKFRAEAMLNGKMWLSLASGLGISLAVTLILILSKGYPMGLPKEFEMLLLASVYLGGAIIGVSYVCLTLILNVSTNSGITQGVAQRYLKILFGITLARAAVLLAVLFLPRAGGRLYSGGETYLSTAPGKSEPVHYFFGNALVVDGTAALHGGQVFPAAMVLLGLVVVVLPALSFAALYTSRMASRVQPTRILVVLLFAATVAEIIARLLVI